MSEEYSQEIIEAVEDFCKQEKVYVTKALDLANKIKFMPSVSDRVKAAVENEIDLLLDIMSKLNEYEKSFKK